MEAQPQDSWSLGARRSVSLYQSLSSVSLAQFLRLVLPLTIVFVFAFILEYRAEVAADETRFLTQETAVIQRGIHRAQREVETATGELFFVADLVADTLGDATPERLGALERSLLSLVRRRPDYLQIRFLGIDGREVLRVENASSRPRIVPQSEFQDKSQRDYFIEAMRLAAGETFVSQMELNVERGAIEEPYRPVVRLATPLDDGSGRRRGIVVLNIHGERFLRSFERSTDKSGVQRMIVNADGYWLQHRPEVEWGFMLEHGRSFQRSFPEVWTQMSADDRGRIEIGEGLFFFDTAPLLGGAGSTGPKAERQISWLLISWIPRDILDDIAVPIATRLLVIAVPLLFALLAIGVLVAAARERRRLHDEALQSLDRVRSVIMTAALDAIVVMDQNGTTLEFNPSAQRIFGYTLDEAKGKPVADLIIPPAHREAHQTGLTHFLRTGEGPIIDKHIDTLTGIRKNGEEFPVELTVCTITVTGTHLFIGFLRDLGEPSGREEARGVRRDDEIL